MSEPRYRVGDRVRVARRPDDVDEGPGWLASMDAYLGTPAAVTSVSCSSSGGSAWYELEDIPWDWDERWLEPAGDEVIPAAERDGPSDEDRRARAHAFALAVMHDATSAGLELGDEEGVVMGTIAKLAWDLVDAMDAEEARRIDVKAEVALCCDVAAKHAQE